jgi:hypothetical protein
MASICRRVDLSGERWMVEVKCASGAAAPGIPEMRVGMEWHTIREKLAAR